MLVGGVGQPPTLFVCCERQANGRHLWQELGVVHERGGAQDGMLVELWCASTSVHSGLLHSFANLVPSLASYDRQVCGM